MNKQKFSLFFGIMFLITFSFSCGKSGVSNTGAKPADSTSTGTVTNNDSVFTIANWNIEWFGSTSNGVANKDLQQANVLKVLRYLKPDIVGLGEVVDIARILAVTDSLGKNYYCQVSQYASSAANASSANYAAAQKLAFIYDSSEVKVRYIKAYLAGNSTASYNFASGRFPYMLNADVTKNGITKNITFFMIHAKAGADATSYQRRTDASSEFQTQLSADGLNTKDMIIMGDFNDELQGTIATGKTVSPYNNFVQDADYAPISLPLQQNNATSMIDNPSVIDHQIISSVFDKMYLQGSIQIRTDVVNIIPGYLQNNTSDHYPVTSQFIFNSARAN